MVTFDQALPTLVRVCEAHAGFLSLKRCCAVRDLRGRLRLVVDPDASLVVPIDLTMLSQSLKRELGRYFVEPIWSTSPQGKRADEARLARTVLGKAKVWTDAAYDDPATGRARVPSAARWWKFERRLSKQEWLESSDFRLPWDLAASTPGIVTFYSFKGGVGRTTALVACAWQWAREGKRVAVIDLDLEAPGLGALLDAHADRGVLDFLADHIAVGSTDLTGVVAERARALGDDGDRVHVLSAGRLDPSYLEKLGRLDFLATNPHDLENEAASPIEQALRDLLHAVRRELRPDYILIDSRAGLHDLAGLSLHRLAHVDVLVGRASEQGYEGLDLTLGVLAKRKGVDKLQCVLAHTMAPTRGLPEAVTEEQEFRHRSYEIFQKHVYLDARRETITEDDADAVHAPRVIRHDSRLVRFASPRDIESAFFESGFVELRARIEELCRPEGDAE